MFKNSVHKDYSLVAIGNRRWAWLETPLLTALVLGLCYWLHPADPLFLQGFPWPILAPLLLAVRYGFLQGACSAALLVLAALVLHRLGMPGYVQLPGSFIVGVLVSSMVVGEFRDLWGRRLERLQTANEYRQYRLDEFTRAYHVLRSSHERLEQRVAGSDTSLRSTRCCCVASCRTSPKVIPWPKWRPRCWACWGSMVRLTRPHCLPCKMAKHNCSGRWPRWASPARCPLTICC